MWVNLLGDTGVAYQGVFTALEFEKSGVVVAWIPPSSGGDFDGLNFVVTNSERQDLAIIRPANFTSNYGFNVWVHYVFVYKYAATGSEALDNMNIYMDGIVQPSDKRYSPVNENPRVQDQGCKLVAAAVATCS